jgi:hypothetical protein
MVKTTTKRLLLGDLETSPKMKVFTITPTADNSFKIASNLQRIGIELMIRKWLNKTQSVCQASFINFINHYSDYSFRASLPKSELAKSNIRNIKGVSNSRLTQLLHQLKGTVQTYPARCLVFGSAVHESILEPENFVLEHYNLRRREQEALVTMKQQLEQHPFYQLYFGQAQKEVVKTWTDKDTGLSCKGKIDLVLNNGEIADLKTTSANSYQEFIKSLSQYDIDRQAAFYMRGCKTRRFWVIGLQKRSPYHIFVKAFYCNSKFIRTGRKKENFLLRKFKDLEIEL